MGCKWGLVSLTDIANISTGKSNRQDATGDGRYVFFDRSQEAKRSDRYLFDAKAIIVPGEGKEFIPRYYEGKFDLHQRVYAVLPNEGCEPKFIYYAIMNDREHFSRVAVGSTVKSLRRSSFETMYIPFPNYEIQCAMAAVLSTIDEKIALNGQINGYLAAWR